MDLDDLYAHSPTCRGCLGPVPAGRLIWCSTQCMNYVRNHPTGFTRIFRRCRACGIEIDHLSLKAEHCSTECWSRRYYKNRPERSVSCSVCSGDLERPGAAVCSERCRLIATGRIFPASATCALPECGAVFLPKKAGQRCCCERHGKRLYNRESRADGRQKNPEWSDARRDRYHRRRAAKKATSSGAPVLLAEIAERDGWSCHLCPLPVDPTLVWPDVMSASLDHVAPLSKGGVHAPENVRLAHVRCNVARGNRDAEELLLHAG
jgi:HNH endonuclease.